MVPPTVARTLVNLAASSMVTRSNVGLSKNILTKLKLFAGWKSIKKNSRNSLGVRREGRGGVEKQLCKVNVVVVV